MVVATVPENELDFPLNPVSLTPTDKLILVKGPKSNQTPNSRPLRKLKFGLGPLNKVGFYVVAKWVQGNIKVFLRIRDIPALPTLAPPAGEPQREEYQETSGEVESAVA